MGGIEADKIYEVMENISNGTEVKSVYLVGGCIRDHVLGAPIKDYDIAITVGLSSVGRKITEPAMRGWLAGRFSTGIICPSSAATYAEEFEGTPIENYKFKYKGLDIDIIRVMEGTVLEWIDTFPCEASKVYFEYGTDNYSLTQAHTAQSSQIFYYEADCPDGYKERLRSKYPQYTHLYKKGPAMTATTLKTLRSRALRSCS